MSGLPRIADGVRSLARRLRFEQRGQIIPLIAVLAVGFLALVSFVIDYAHIKNTQKELQAAADAAALAGAMELPDANAAFNTALSYSANPLNPTGKNSRPELPDNTITDVDSTLCLNYLKNLGLNLCPNAIRVRHDADVPLLFLGGLGIPGIHVHATSTAAMKGGSAYPLDVMIVLDRTGSMGDNTQSGVQKMAQARAGVQTFLSAMKPSSDKIGLALFPPTTSTSCNYNVGTNPYENAQNGYVVVHLRSDFRTSDTGPLNGSSPLVKAVTGSCPSVSGITAYTSAIRAAKTELNTNGRSNAQDVIIFFTDGEANYGPCVPNCGATSERTQPCHSALNLANSYKVGAPPPGEAPDFVGGTWVYTILYTDGGFVRCTAYRPSPAPSSCRPSSSNTSFPVTSTLDPAGGLYCDEQPLITAYETLEQMASVGRDGTTRFYTSNDDLTQVFKRVAIDLTMIRLLSDDTQ